MCSAQYCLHCLDCCIILSFNSLLLNYQNLFTKGLIISVNSKQHTASSSYVIPPSFLSVNSVDDKFSWLSWMVVNRTICFVWSAAATLQGGYWYQILLPARFSWLLVTVRVRHNISQTRIIELINLVQSTVHIPSIGFRSFLLIIQMVDLSIPLSDNVGLVMSERQMFALLLIILK